MHLQGWKCVSGPDREHTYFLFMPEGRRGEQEFPPALLREYGPFVPIPGSLGGEDKPEIGLSLPEAQAAIAAQGHFISRVRKPGACEY